MSQMLVADRPWQSLGSICAVATVSEGAESLFLFVMRITHDFTDFTSDKFYDIGSLKTAMKSILLSSGCYVGVAGSGRGRGSKPIPLPNVSVTSVG